MSSERTQPPSAEGPGPLVWDLPLRLFHWSLVLAVGGAFVSDWIGTAAFDLHVLCGESALVLVAFRVLWGVVGPAHARFGDFVRGPRSVLASLPTLTRAGHRRYAGHTPLGGWMVLLLLALIGAQASLGLFANDEVSNTGPLYGYVGGHLSNRLSAWHARIANVILGAVALHVAAALYYRIVLDDDLVRPLISGRKPGLPAAAAIGAQRLWLAAAILALLSVALLALVRLAPDAVLEL